MIVVRGLVVNVVSVWLWLERLDIWTSTRLARRILRLWVRLLSRLVRAWFRAPRRVVTLRIWIEVATLLPLWMVIGLM